MIIAAQKGHFDAVKLILESGAAETLDKNGKGAYFYCKDLNAPEPLLKALTIQDYDFFAVTSK